MKIDRYEEDFIIEGKILIKIGDVYGVEGNIHEIKISHQGDIILPLDDWKSVHRMLHYYNSKKNNLTNLEELK